MPYPIDKKLVVAVSSIALFNMEESDKVFREEGIEKYREFQEDNLNNPFYKGVAFPFIKRLLYLNKMFPEEQPVEVVLMSKNSPETGLRAFRSIEHYKLNITRGYFSSGEPNFRFLPAFNACLFLSANSNDTREAVKAGYAAGTVLNTGQIEDDEQDRELRVGFDFDGVIADDTADKFFQEHNKDMNDYMVHEKKLADSPLDKGPIADLLKRISFFQLMEKKRIVKDKTYKRLLKTYIVTARNAPAHERVVTTLKQFNIEVDGMFLLGGIEKSRVLNQLQPHIFFDDQKPNFDNLKNVPAVHIPFGFSNQENDAL